ncbi:MAG: pilus assembly protein PilM, partial [Leptolyngbya sp. SIO4C1]|nr:pilus assembly protein PilM [Leptolyngbya sp. SIO4C1]
MDSLKSLFSRKPPGVGVELTPERVNVARMRKQGQKIKLETLASAEIPEGIFEEGQIIDTAAMAEAIRSALAESKLKVKRATTAIPGRAITRVIPVPAELDDQ